MVGDFANAQMVLFGTFKNAKLGGGVLDEGTSDFAIEKVLKNHEIVQGKGMITIPKYVDRPKSKFLLYCDVYKGRIDPYRAAEVTEESQLLKYIEGAIALKDKSISERLRYCADFLTSPEMEVSMDAYREFAKADYKDYMNVAKKLDPERIAGWLRDSKTPSYRYGLYASLLGHCGGPKHAELLNSMVLDPEKRKNASVDGLFAGSIMIQPKESWKFLLSHLDNPKEDFNMRYACIRTIRFLWDQRPDLIDKNELAAAMVAAAKHPDVSDFAIDDLRRWKRWETSKFVLGLFNEKSHNVGVIQRAILRFGLQSPESEAAKFVEAQRKRDLEWVRDTEEILKLETDTK